VEVLISLSPSDRDIRGVFYLRSLGKVVRPFSTSVTTHLRNVTFLNVVDVFIILRFSDPVKSDNQETVSDCLDEIIMIHGGHIPFR
jgi:hypothetical protein